MFELNNLSKINIENYVKLKKTELFLESLIQSRPLPNFVAPKKQLKNDNGFFGLDRIRSFLEKIGKPHLKNKYIHITGTSGKTSTSYFVSSLLFFQGYSTGLYISPHMVSFLERFMINMKLPPVLDILNIIEKFKPMIDEEYENSGMGVISYFEFSLIVALEYFYTQNTDYVVLEVGMGGRYDATNVIEDSEISIITNIGLDHTHILGNTREEIAYDKSGIIKNNNILLTAESDKYIIDIMKKEAKNKNSVVEEFGKDFKVENFRMYHDKTLFDYRSNMNSYNDLETVMMGEYQLKNISLSIRTLELIVNGNGEYIDETLLRKGIDSTLIPGRYEKINDNPIIILDGAHNTDKIANLTKFLKKKSDGEKNIIFVCGFTSGKCPESMLKFMMEISDSFYFTKVVTNSRESEEPLYLKKLLESLKFKGNCKIKLEPFSALDEAIQEAKNFNKIICITGSLYLISYIRERWYPENKIIY